MQHKYQLKKKKKRNKKWHKNGTQQSKTGKTENKEVMQAKVGVRNVSVTHRGGEKPTVRTIGL